MVRRALILLLPITSLAALGCAAGEIPGREAKAPSANHGLAAYGPAPRLAAAIAGIAGPAAAAREAASPRSEGAAFLAQRLSDSAKIDVDEQIASTVARCPAEMALVDDRVCVDRWEASLVERAGGSEKPWSPFVPIEGHEQTIRAVSRPGVIPQGYISGKQAAVACNASGKRLCNAREWESACRGPTNSQFPYGATRRAGVCNDDIRARHPVAEAGVLLGIPGQALWHAGMNQAIINQLQDTLLPTGERAECTNEYGVFDMVGNLHEWVDDPDGTFRGGYYMDTSKNGEGCSYATTAHDFTYHDYSTGFRCCMDPERVEESASRRAVPAWSGCALRGRHRRRYGAFVSCKRVLLLISADVRLPSILPPLNPPIPCRIDRAFNGDGDAGRREMTTLARGEAAGALCAGGARCRYWARKDVATRPSSVRRGPVRLARQRARLLGCLGVARVAREAAIAALEDALLELELLERRGRARLGDAAAFATSLAVMPRAPFTICSMRRASPALLRRSSGATGLVARRFSRVVARLPSGRGFLPRGAPRRACARRPIA